MCALPFGAQTLCVAVSVLTVTWRPQDAAMAQFACGHCSASGELHTLLPLISAHGLQMRCACGSANLSTLHISHVARPRQSVIRAACAYWLHTQLWAVQPTIYASMVRMVVMVCAVPRCIRTFQHRTNWDKVNGMPGSGTYSTSTGFPVTVRLACGVVVSGGDAGESIKVWSIDQGMCTGAGACLPGLTVRPPTHCLTSACRPASLELT